jgi:serine/threonine protein kinase
VNILLCLFISCRFITNLKFAFQDTENLYLVFDYLSGGDLRYYLNKKILFSEKQASKYNSYNYFIF